METTNCIIVLAVEWSVKYFLPRIPQYLTGEEHGEQDNCKALVDFR